MTREAHMTINDSPFQRQGKLRPNDGTKRRRDGGTSQKWRKAEGRRVRWCDGAMVRRDDGKEKMIGR
jgi:hypothetical protein